MRWAPSQLTVRYMRNFMKSNPTLGRSSLHRHIRIFIVLLHLRAILRLEIQHAMMNSNTLEYRQLASIISRNLRFRELLSTLTDCPLEQCYKIDVRRNQE